MKLLLVFAIGILVLFLVLVFWTFKSATTEQRIAVLTTVASLVGVVAGWLFQEGRVQDKQEQVETAQAAVVEARDATAGALEIAADAESRMAQVERLLFVDRQEVRGRVALPKENIVQAEALLRERPDSAELLIRPRR